MIRLTPQEEQFAVAIALGKPVTRAAQHAGWCASSARNVLARPHIAATVRHMAANLQKVVQKMDAEASA
ncbi:MAG: hypothetical protein AB7O38_26065 [Pirellulaceae bacterium]